MTMMEAYLFTIQPAANITGHFAANPKVTQICLDNILE